MKNIFKSLIPSSALARTKAQRQYISWLKYPLGIFPAVFVLCSLLFSFSSCFIFRKKNRCDDCPNFHSEIKKPEREGGSSEKKITTTAYASPEYRGN